MWKTKALLVHLLLLVCVLKIYFQSAPLIHHLEPQVTLPKMGVKQPADRLVVFLAEGLNAETFFSQNFSALPQLGEIYGRQGLLGIAHSSVPTLTQAGNVALFAGFHPLPFLNENNHDTIFNRTLNSPDGLVLKFLGDNPKTESGLIDLQEHLSYDGNQSRIRNASRALILVRLDDVGGASPRDERYLEKLYRAQMGILETYEVMESVFGDNRTAYLMTSSHGLSSHGGGTPYETQTPFHLWGSGILANQTIQSLKQIQLAPLMSALIGLPPPVNNLGQLPLGFLKVSPEEEGKAMHLNALQLLLQAKVLVKRHKRGYFYKWLPKAGDLDLLRISHYQYQMNRLTETFWQAKAMETSQVAASLALKTVKSYVKYYNIPLKLATALALAGWEFFLVLKLSRESRASKELRRGFLTWNTILLASLGLLLGELAFLQDLTPLTILCLVVPFAFWCLAMAEQPLTDHSILDVRTHSSWIGIPAVLIVVTFCCSYSLGLVYALGVGFYNRLGWVRPSLKVMFWWILVVLLTVFLLLLPKMEFLMDTNYRMTLQATSMLLVILRPYIFNENHEKRVWIVNGGMLILGGVGIYLKETGKEIPIYMMATNWAFLFYAFASIPYSGSTCLRSRLQLICFNLLTVHALLSDSYTSLFAQLLILEYQQGIEVHLQTRLQMKEEEDKEESMLTSKEYLQLCYRFAVSILLYFFVSMMGTGHWLQSFTYLAITDRLFMPHCCPFMFGFLVFIHMLIPLIIILASLRALSTFGRHEISSILICVMLICNAVVLFFVMFVCHLSDWPNVHPSVIKVILVQLTTALLMACDWCGIFLFRGFNLITSTTPKRAVVQIRPKANICSRGSMTSREV
ncbi:hypothetical protein KR054_000470 [Drosophila jambulina]|nr:hypothetical protein KR054_000470 [Drosophila jambulina]